MKIVYFDCSSGISGDMIISALLNAGIDSKKFLEKMKEGLIPYISGKWNIEIKKLERNHFPATQIDVRGDKRFSTIDEMIRAVRKTKFSKNVKDNSIKILELLKKAEQNVHGKKHTELHQMGSIDTIIDITGACLCMELLEIKKVFSSPLNTGSPAPATLWIIKNKKIPVYSTGVPYELVTPTGACIISSICDDFGNMPEMKIISYGFGSGSYQLDDKISKSVPGILKVFIGDFKSNYFSRDLILLETNIDDMDTRVYPYVIKKLLESGARDAWLTNILMKKGRPGFKLSVLTEEEKEKQILDVIFKETTTLGVRKIPVSRYELERFKKGEFKIAILPDGQKKLSVEYKTALKKEKSDSKKPLYKILQRSG